MLVASCRRNRSSPCAQKVPRTQQRLAAESHLDFVRAFVHFAKRAGARGADSRNRCDNLSQVQAVCDAGNELGTECAASRYDYLCAVLQLSAILYTLTTKYFSRIACTEQRLSILNDVWKVVTKLTDPVEYITVANVFIEYPTKHCGVCSHKRQ
jgi:hypothetical protein